MGQDFNARPTPEALLSEAQAGGAGSALAAKRAAVLAERRDPALAIQALGLAARLEPLDPAPRLGLARLHAEQGDLAAARLEASAVLAEAVDQAARARAAFMLGEMARVSGEADGARSSFETVLKIEGALLAGNRSDPTAARWYARARGRIAELDANAGHFDRARTSAEGALAMLRGAAAQIGEPPVLAADIADAEMRLAALELDVGEANSARRRLGEAIGRYEALAITEKDEPHWRAVLSDAWALAAEADYVRGARDEARAAMDKALQARIRLAANHSGEAWGLAGTWRVRAALCAAIEDTGAATESLEQARALAETLFVRAGGSDAAARFLVHTLLDQADHALRSSDINRAREAADTARLEAEGRAAQPNAHAAWFGEAGACWDRLGEVARAANALAQAQDAFARAVEFRRLARERDENSAAVVRGVAAALVKLGDAALEASASESARAAYRESVGLRLALAEAAPHDTRAAHVLAAALERLGLAALACGDRAAARAAWEEELMLAERIFGEDDSVESLRFCAIVEAHLAEAGGHDAESHRLASLARFDELAKAGALTEREAALRRKLWGN
jgi:tetratricopeptide (TPR) repeat protein